MCLSPRLDSLGLMTASHDTLSYESTQWREGRHAYHEHETLLLL